MELQGACPCELEAPGLRWEARWAGAARSAGLTAPVQAPRRTPAGFPGATPSGRADFGPLLRYSSITMRRHSSLLAPCHWAKIGSVSAPPTHKDRLSWTASASPASITGITANTGARVEGSHFIGRLEWTRQGDVLVVEHTVVPPEIGGRGIATVLLDAVIADAREQGFRDRPEMLVRRAEIRAAPRNGATSGPEADRNGAAGED